jgi:hypothetical protein
MSLQIIGTLSFSPAASFAQESRNTAAAVCACPGDNGGITLPPDFCPTVFADHIGHARQMVLAPDGVLYVNTWSGRYYRNDTPPSDGFLVALQDTSGKGSADLIKRFGPGAESGNAGGSGIALFNGWLHAETNDRIVRYALPASTIAPNAPPEVHQLARAHLHICVIRLACRNI